MSSVSGSAAGTPSGMTAASRTLGKHDHHWFPEPTEPAKKSYVAWLLIAMFIFFIALLGPAIVGVGVKVQSLIAIGAIPKEALNSSLAVLGGWGALFATLANVIFGRVSDRTTSRWGRRRIWLVLGTVIMTIGFIPMAFGTNLPVATVGWCIAQLGANMTLAPYVATIADQVPRFQRGSVSAAFGIAQNVGIVGGTYVASWFVGNLFVMFVVPAIVAIIAVTIFAFVLPDKVLPVKPPRMTFVEFIGTIWTSPVKYPDFALAWWSRFLITFASFGFTAFRFGYMAEHIGVGKNVSATAQAAEISSLVANTTLIYTIMLVITSYIFGRMSDKLGRRKIFVWISTALFAVGTVALIFIHSVPEYFVLEAFMGAAYGIYVSVDLALVMDVLPNPDDSAKDLGVLNIANALPQTLAPAIGGALLYVGSTSGNNYMLWFSICGAAALIGAAVIFPIRSVK